LPAHACFLLALLDDEVGNEVNGNQILNVVGSRHREMIMKIQHQIRRIAVAAVAITAVVLMSGCATNFTAAQNLERWGPGETKDLMLVRGVHAIPDTLLQSECKDGKLNGDLKDKVAESDWLAFLKQNVCPNLAQWKLYSGPIKSDFNKGQIIGRGLIPPGLNVEVDDIVEVSHKMAADGRNSRHTLVTRIIRKNALKEPDSTCYWDGQGGRFDAFATGGVMCPAEGWDWRDQKWAKK
jgi:hypothetical protein